MDAKSKGEKKQVKRKWKRTKVNTKALRDSSLPIIKAD